MWSALNKSLFYADTPEVLFEIEFYMQVHFIKHLWCINALENERVYFSIISDIPWCKQRFDSQLVFLHHVWLRVYFYYLPFLSKDKPNFYSFVAMTMECHQP